MKFVKPAARVTAVILGARAGEKFFGSSGWKGLAAAVGGGLAADWLARKVIK